MVIALSEYARHHKELSLRRLSKLAHDGRIPSARKIGGMWVVEEYAPLPVRRSYKTKAKSDEEFWNTALDRREKK